MYLNNCRNNLFKKKDILNVKKKLRTQEQKKKVLKALAFSSKVKREKKFFFFKKIYEKKLIFFTKINSRCTFSGYSKSVYRKYNMNRMFLKHIINKGYFPGIVSATW